MSAHDAERTCANHMRTENPTEPKKVDPHDKEGHKSIPIVEDRISENRSVSSACEDYVNGEECTSDRATEGMTEGEETVGGQQTRGRDNPTEIHFTVNDKRSYSEQRPQSPTQRSSDYYETEHDIDQSRHPFSTYNGFYNQAYISAMPRPYNQQQQELFIPPDAPLPEHMIQGCIQPVIQCAPATQAYQYDGLSQAVYDISNKVECMEKMMYLLVDTMRTHIGSLGDQSGKGEEYSHPTSNSRYEHQQTEEGENHSEMEGPIVDQTAARNVPLLRRPQATGMQGVHTLHAQQQQHQNKRRDNVRTKNNGPGIADGKGKNGNEQGILQMYAPRSQTGMGPHGYGAISGPLPRQQYVRYGSQYQRQQQQQQSYGTRVVYKKFSVDSAQHVDQRLLPRGCGPYEDVAYEVYGSPTAVVEDTNNTTTTTKEAPSHGDIAKPTNTMRQVTCSPSLVVSPHSGKNNIHTLTFTFLYRTWI